MAKQARWIDADDLDLQRIKVFAPYALLFVLGIFANMRALQASNVETIIVFRTGAPLFVSILDWLFLGRELPSGRSICCLLWVIAGTIGYVHADSEFQMHGFRAYAWTLTYLVSIVFSIAFGKRLMTGIEFRAPIWGLVLYSNVVSAPLLVLLALFAGEAGKLDACRASPGAVLSLVISCVVGLGISWSGWNCQEKISATAYTLVGVAFKLLTVLMNSVLGYKHASPTGMLWLSVCIGVSTLYQQAPMRDAKS